MMESIESMTAWSGPSCLLLVDDDATFCRVLGLALSRRGFTVTTAHNHATALQLAQRITPDYAIVDLNLAGDSGLSLIPHLLVLDSAIRIVVLTGYASIATAVEAIKLGAVNYLTKPADADQVLAAFAAADGNPAASVSARPLSVNRLEWEHIQQVLLNNNGNISATARQLNMHRRTLQRKLAKRPVKF
ncbi:MAG: response regulator transcription factor [Candidatus Competibacteraceae bacterium]|nr:response regulator transcription factor [Candidatus Competibacteraceae bacterium]MCP5132115.1 response regulator transcription factor [Gammaproteobacteria bacterium]